MKVQMNSQKCRIKSLKVVAAAMALIGDGVDAVELIRALRMKVSQTHILSLAEVKGNQARNLAQRIKLNMKQKIVMKVQMNCKKCRTKALKVAAAANGVNFVGLEGQEKEKLVVIGDGVDAANLAISLRKKVGYTDLLSVSEEKDK
ncbi:hypothetical protein L6164_036071 [Bauhinia variegata]|uniref:Uncharacterized protein n=1 Tax=Bauhinia variegata TaxID=167791 RepID=A0ACB9KGP2_BAUVA|nr:hypothetical protein L6164_036071 [Bauhinia variegata]